MKSDLAVQLLADVLWNALIISAPLLAVKQRRGKNRSLAQSLTFHQYLITTRQ